MRMRRLASATDPDGAAFDDAAATAEAQAAWLDAHGSTAEAALILACAADGRRTWASRCGRADEAEVHDAHVAEHLRRALRADPALWAAWDLALRRAKRDSDPMALTQFACHLADQPAVPPALACETIQAVLSTTGGASPADRLAVCAQLRARIDPAQQPCPAADLAGAYVDLAAGRLDDAKAALRRVLVVRPACGEAKRLLALAGES